MKFTENFANRLVNLACGLMGLVLASSLQAQTPGKAEVRAIKGRASYSAQGGALAPLKAGTVLYSGSTIKTESGSTVDLFLGNSAGFVRIAENTTLGLDKLAFTETGADTVVEVQMNLPDGTILGNVNKLSAASKYEVKVPNGVAGIRGTRYRISSTGYVVLLEGSLIMVYVPPGGQPTPYPLFAPPAQVFSPPTGVTALDPAQLPIIRNEFPAGPSEFPPPTLARPIDPLPFIPPSPTLPAAPAAPAAPATPTAN